MLGGWVGAGRRLLGRRRRARPAGQRARRAAPAADVPTLERAYVVAEELHRGQRRKSGEPFITHPLAVATILANLGLDTTTLVAALLHDTVEDTGYTLTRTQQDFGLEVAHLVDGVTKLDKVRFGADAEAESLRKMIVAGGRDLRVLVIKLADRLHNMRTLRYQPADKQQRIARATQDVLVPLADRLGIHVLKRELEGLCFAVLQPAEAAVGGRAGPGAPPAPGPAQPPRSRPSSDRTCATARIAATDLRAPPPPRTRRTGPAGSAAAPAPSCSTRPGSWSSCRTRRPRTATRRWGSCTAAGGRCRAGSRTTSRCRSSTSTSRCTRRCSARAASRWTC